MASKHKGKERAVSVDFSFIADKRLRGDGEDALDFSAYLISSADEAKEPRYKEEFYRATVLYVASVIEALCLFLVETKKLSREKIEYKYPQRLNVEGVSVSVGELVAAVKIKTPRNLQDLPFAEAIGILRRNNIVPEPLAKDLDSVRIARNTQHLYGRTDGVMSRKEIQAAFDALSNLLGQIHKVS